MSSQMIVRIDPELKNKINRLAKSEGKSVSMIVRELLEEYVRDRDISSYIDDLWNRIGQKFKSRGIRPEDIKGAIKNARDKK